MMPWLKDLKPPHELYGRSAAELIAELKSDGILITAGEHRDAPLLFLHRTFHEYLAACALAQQEDWLDVARAHVYHPEWQEVLRLLGGVLEERAVEYVAALLHENEDDLLCRPLRIAVFTAAEAHPGHLTDGFSDKFLELIIELYMNQPKWLYPEEIHQLVISWGEKATRQLLPLLRNENPSVRLKAMQAFSQIGTVKVLPHLVPLCKDVNWGVRYKVAETLGKIGTSEVIQYLLLLLKDVNPDVCYVAVKALGQMRASEAIPDMLPLLLETNAGNPHLSKAAAMALGRIGTETLPHLLSWLEDANLRSQQLFFKYWHVYEAVARTLGQIGTEEVVPHLLTLLKDVSYKYVRRAVSEALGLVGTKAVPHLLPLLKDEDSSIRYAVVEALRRIGAFEAVPYLLPLIGEGNVAQVEVQAIRQIGQRQKRAIPVIGSPSHVQVWMQSLTRSLKLLLRKYLMIANY